MQDLATKEETEAREALLLRENPNLEDLIEAADLLSTAEDKSLGQKFLKVEEEMLSAIE